MMQQTFIIKFAFVTIAALSSCQKYKALKSKLWKNDDSKTTTEQKNDSETAQYFPVKKADLTDLIEIRGKIEASEQIDIRADKRIRLKPARVKPLNHVKKGEILFEVDTKELETKKSETKERFDQTKIDLDSARKQLEFTEKQLKRKQTLSEKGITAKRELEEAQKQYDTALTNLKTKTLDLKKAEREHESATQTVSSANIVAPIDGIVAKILPGGDEANPGQVLATIANESSLSLMADAADIYASKLTKGMQAQAKIDAIGNEPIQVTIKAIGMTAVTNPNSGIQNKYRVEAGLDAKTVKQYQLKDGYEGTLLVTLDTKKSVLTIPLAALKKIGKDYYVLASSKPNGTPASKPVNIGLTTDLEAEVVSGLQVGEFVIASRGAAQTP